MPTKPVSLSGLAVSAWPAGKNGTARSHTSAVLSCHGLGTMRPCHFSSFLVSGWAGVEAVELLLQLNSIAKWRDKLVKVSTGIARARARLFPMASNWGPAQRYSSSRRRPGLRDIEATNERDANDHGMEISG